MCVMPEGDLPIVQVFLHVQTDYVLEIDYVQVKLYLFLQTPYRGRKWRFNLCSRGLKESLIRIAK